MAQSFATSNPSALVATSRLTGKVGAAQGGTNIDTSGATAGSILATESTGTWSVVAPGATGEVLTSNGANPPVWAPAGGVWTRAFLLMGA